MPISDQELAALRGRPVLLKLRTANPEQTWDFHAELASHDPTWIQLRNPRASQRNFAVRRDMAVSIEADASAAGARV